MSQSAPSPTITDLLRGARSAQRTLARATAEDRTRCLDAVVSRVASARDAVLDANALDLARATDLTAALRDRLALSPARLDGVLSALRGVRELPDPLGEERELSTRPNGLRVSKRRIPLGVIAVIYEARPNVTVEAAALCIRSGNAVVLRGGSEARETNAALADAVRRGLTDAGMNPDAVAFVRDPDRERVAALLGAVGLVDLVIPRGGRGLMDFVDAHAKVPVIRHGAGVCHVYVDRAADVSMAEEVAFNAKVHRPGVCNAAETLIVHRDAARELLPSLGQRLSGAGVELRADDEARAVFTAAGVRCLSASERDWDTEFLALVLAVRVVGSLDEALAHIADHGTEHSASIVTDDEETAERFLREVDASCVLWNASTRFNDGSELGLGAEIGISTTRMHAFGPMSARELTAEKFVVRGSGQVRGGA